MWSLLVNKVLVFSPWAWGQEERSSEIAGLLGVLCALSLPDRDHNFYARRVRLALGQVGCRENHDPKELGLGPKHPRNFRVGADRSVAGAVLRATHRPTAAAGYPD